MLLRLQVVAPITVATVLFAATAQAQCEFGSGVGTKLRVPMVKAYEECFSSTVNTETESAVSACTPVKDEPLGYRCTGTNSYCDGLDADCPHRYCGQYLPHFPGEYLGCVTNSDCPTFYNDALGGPQSNGICEDHPGDACQADPANASFRFAPGGSCTLTASSKVEKDCSRLTSADGVQLGLFPRPCHVTKLRVRCRKIVDSSGTPISSGAGVDWSLRTLTRITFDDPESGDMTQIDFPATILFGEPHNGSIELESSTAEVLLPVLGPVGAALPPCTNLQPVDFRVVTHGGLGSQESIFARVGMATQP
jgi:hypothetical protein